MELDDTDIRILEALQKEGRLSFNDIAKEVGVSTPTVSTRVATLSDLGLIRGFTVDLVAELLNELTGMMIVDCRPADVGALSERLESFDEVRELYVIDGTRLMAKVTTLNNDHLNLFFDSLSEVEEISSYRYHTVTRTAKEHPRALIHEGLKLTIDCYYCRKPIVENPVKIKMDGKDHYLCCGSCEILYRDKYDKLKEGSEMADVRVAQDDVGDSHDGHHGHNSHHGHSAHGSH
jgi:DNA-binding Lrp family transcriptional regulator